MEAFLYTLAATFVAALATIAYKHPDSYRVYVYPTLTMLVIAAFLFAAGHHIATIEASTRASEAILAMKSPQPELFAIRDAINNGEIPSAIWLAIYGMFFYLFLLLKLADIGLTADRQGPPKSSS